MKYSLQSLKNNLLKLQARQIVQTGCWGWLGSVDKDGYGRFPLWRGAEEKAHRAAWALHHNQEVPVDKIVLHSCDNPSCTNPEHLFLGTSLENTQDCIEKNRRACQIGSQNGAAFLDEYRVAEIKVLLALGELTQRQIAKRFYVSRATIQFISCGKRWAHV